MWGLQHHCKFIAPNDPDVKFSYWVCSLKHCVACYALCARISSVGILISFLIDGIDLDSSTSMGFIHNFVFYLGSFGISWVMWYFMILDSVSRAQNLETMPPRDGSCRQSHTISSDLLSLWFNPNPYVIWTSCRTWQNHLKWPSLILSLMYSTSTL